MRTPALPSPRRIAAGAGLALLAAGLTPIAASANPAGTGLVISEVYGAGGNTGAAYNADFVEIHNPTAAPVDLRGKYVAYRSATGGFAGSMALRGTLPADGRYLVRMSTTGTNGSALPTPDRIASPAISMATAGGQIFLQEGAAPVVVTGEVAGLDRVIDMVGSGSGGDTPTSFEGAPGPGATLTSSANRTAAGADTDNNAADFTLAAPSPVGCGCVPTPGTFSGSIAEIQGVDEHTSPRLDDTVTTRGVVTAVYGTGGFNGFYMQTQGTGGASDATPGASDAIFVFGNAAMAVSPVVGDFLEVVGPVSEFGGNTQITPGTGGVTKINGEEHTDPTAFAGSLPGTACELGSCPSAAALDADREAHEGEVYAPTGPYTVTNAFSLTNAANGFMEIGLAADTKPLMAPTEEADFQTGNIAERTAYNNAHAVTIDDGSSANYTTSASGTPMPWITRTHTVRVGADATFTGPVVLDYRNNAWKVQPTSQVTGIGTEVMTFEQTRASNAAPAPVGGDLKLGTFNVLNYFNTTGEDWEAQGGGKDCSFFNDRAGNPVTNNQCTPNGPRGAAQKSGGSDLTVPAADFERQQAKIVTAINTMNADIVSLEEIENSVALGETNRDDALSALVTALNAAAGSTRWAFAPSPAASDLPPLAEQDVIRNAFIYNPTTVKLVGASDVLTDSAPFANAREPLAQAFKKTGTPNSAAFGVIVNHFKSKSASGATGDNLDVGQGGFNGDRVRQAEALATFANDFKTARGISKIFLTGDFNSYSEEDPIQALEAAGYTKIDSDTPGEESYSFSGLSGSLDHVFANAAAIGDVTGADIWDINASEPLAYQYSRFNYNATDFFDASNPFNSSDHNPEVVGIDTSSAGTEIQILGTNDFHGRLLNNTGAPFPNDAGAAVLSGAVKQLRGQNPNTVFAAAGDLIGASTFESFIQKDVPTIDALNEAGLEVSAVGNHEFDAGYADLVDRVIPLADWEYLGANVDKPGAPAEDLLEPTWIKEMGGVQVGFIGAVTEHLDELVSPAGIEGVEIEDIVTATNREANALEAAGVDVIVLLVHEGAPSTDCATMDDDSTSDFGSIINGVNANVDAIVSGHTHLAYNCSFPVPAWTGRKVTERPVVSAGQYGTRLNQLLFEVDAATGEVQAKSQNVLDLESGTGVALYPVDAPTKAIVDAAVAEANTLGAVELGKIAGPFNRAKLADGATENRGGESTLGNLVAEVQRWSTPETVGGAQIAFMNPGGMRADMVGVAGDFPRTLTYRQAANVQSFANTLVNMDMTGAQIKAVLEQQWQPAGASRPFLRLGVSEGFTYTYDPSKPAGSRITGMWLDGVAVGDTTSYSVTANSFLAGGGDNFGAFNQATGKQDTGKVDLAAMVDYMAEFANTAQGDAPLPVDYSQRAVNVTFPAGAPASYAPGDDVAFSLASLSMTGPGDVHDTQVEVALGDMVLGTAPVTTTLMTALPGYDEVGTASVSVELPDCASGEELTVMGNNTGTEVLVPIQVECIATTVTGTNLTVQEGSAGSIPVTVTPATATGEVVLGLGQTTLEATLADGKATIPLAADALPVGVHELPLNYPGDDQHAASSSTVVVTVTAKPAPGAVDSTVTGTAGTVTYGTAGSIAVKVAPAAATGTVAVSKGGALLGSVTLASGQGTVTLPAKSLPVGTHVLTLTYSGDTGHKPSTGPVTVVVVKAEATVTAKVKPKRVVVDETRARIVIRVDAAGFVPTGRVKVLVAGKTYRSKLEDGKAVITLKEFEKARDYTAKISYLGDDTTESARTKVTIKVKRR
jgi:5'-nucleotidase